MTPKGVRLMYRLKPGLSVSARDTSDSDDSAMESRYSARSRKPLTSPAPWEMGLYSAYSQLSCRILTSGIRCLPSHRPSKFLWDCISTLLEFFLHRKVINGWSRMIVAYAYNELVSDSYSLFQRDFSPLFLSIFSNLDR